VDEVRQTIAVGVDMKVPGCYRVFFRETHFCSTREETNPTIYRRRDYDLKAAEDDHLHERKAAKLRKSQHRKATVPSP
jgi:hypothetical protein